MAINFSLYYQTLENCEYLKKIISSSGQGVVVEACPLGNLPPQVNSGTNVVFLEYQEDHPHLDQWIKKTAADPRNPSIYLFFQEISTDQLWKALRLGVKECFVFPILLEEFQEALGRLPLLPVDPGLAEETQLISFLGCKGGVGTTFITANVAYQLAQEEKGQVLMVDLDLRYGQMIYFFDVKPRYSISDIIENADHLDSSYLHSLLYQYDKHLYLLPAPVRLEEAEIVTAENLERILKSIKNLHAFNFILLDVGHQFEELTLKALEMSDKVLLVANQSIPALSNARKLLELFQLIGLDHLELDLWLNSWQKSGDLTMADAAKFLKREIKGTVPFSPEQVGRSINEGHPLAKIAPKEAVCRSLTAITQELAGQASQNNNGTRWGWLKYLGRKK